MPVDKVKTQPWWYPLASCFDLFGVLAPKPGKFVPQKQKSWSELGTWDKPENSLWTIGYEPRESDKSCQ